MQHSPKASNDIFLRDSVEDFLDGIPRGFSESIYLTWNKFLKDFIKEIEEKLLEKIQQSEE